ncbi:MAG: RluA family pseudouridine synthase [Clostridiales bacterium]|nr:RluA family pseudouridine synthase [Clostridiales bacterium]
MKEIVITQNEAGQRLDKFLRKYLKEMSLSAIYKSIRKGQIKVNNKKQSEKYILNEGDLLKFYFEIDEPKKKENKAFLEVDYDLKVAYEDENILVVEKRPDILVHPDEGNEITLTDAVWAYLFDKGEYNPEIEKTFAPSPCNRLDRNTEGLVIFAKTYDALKQMNEAIREGEVQKIYTALVKGKIKEGEYIDYISKNPNTNKVVVSKTKIRDSKEIITKILDVDSVGIASVVEIDLVTGRSHQIRAHLAYLGNPIVGDPKYGDRKLNSFYFNKYGLNHQLLVANKIIFKNVGGNLSYLQDKVVSMNLPPLFKKIKNDLFKF